LGLVVIYKGGVIYQDAIVHGNEMCATYSIVHCDPGWPVIDDDDFLIHAGKRVKVVWF